MRHLIIGLFLVFVACETRTAWGEDISIGTWNVEWFFDHDTSDNESDSARENSPPSKADYQWKAGAIAEAIAQLDVTVIALQEVENEKVVKRVAELLKTKHSLNYDVGFKQGTDSATEQDVAVLVKQGVTFSCSRYKYPAGLRGKQDYKDVSKHLFVTLDFDTPIGKERVLLVTAHLFAADPEEQRRQARTIRYWLSDRPAKGENIVVLGDMNSRQRFNETTPDSAVGILRGFQSPDKKDDLFDVDQKLSGDARRTHISGQEFDRILISSALESDKPGKEDLILDTVEMRSDVVVRKDPDRDRRSNLWKIPPAERDISDHYPIVARFKLVK